MQINSGTIDKFGIFLKFASLTGALPYEWDEKTRSLKIGHGKRRVRLWRTRVLVTFFYFFYLTLQIIYSLAGNQVRKVTDMTIFFIWWESYFLMSLVQVNIMWEKHTTVEFLNKFFRFSEHQLKRYGEARKPFLNILFVLFGLTAVGYISICVLATGFYYRKLYFLSGFVHRHLFRLNYIGRIVFICFEFSTYLCNWLILFFYIFIILCSLTCMKFWLDQVWSKLKSSPRNRSKILLEFKTLLLLNQSFEDCTSPFLWSGHKVIVLPITLAGCYGMTRLYSKVKPQFFGVYPMIAFMTLTFQYIFYQISADLFKVARSINRHNVMTRMNGSVTSSQFYSSFRRLPKYCNSFKMFRQTSPLAFIHKIITVMVRMQIYLHSNIDVFKRNEH